MMLMTLGGMLLAAMAAGSLMLVIWVVLLPTIAYATLRGVIAVGYGLVLGSIVQIVWSLATSRTLAFLLAASAVMAAVAAWRWCQIMHVGVERVLYGPDLTEEERAAFAVSLEPVANVPPESESVMVVPSFGRQRPARLSARIRR